MAKPVPANLIMGFLGVGKTTAIRGLLARHPTAERWAVLVNEFGQVGIDEQLVAGGGVAVKQVPGGCLCCVSSAAFAAGLVQLLRQHRPHRVLIEPSGIGHPTQVIHQLTGADFATALELRASITLVDARKLADPRYTGHPAFTDQLEEADVVVGNKLDGYTAADRHRFMDMARAFDPPKEAVTMVEQGRFPLELLDAPRRVRQGRFPDAHDHHHGEGVAAHRVGPAGAGEGEDGWLWVEGVAADTHSVGWRIPDSVRFRRARLEAWLAGLVAHRVKGVVATDAGWLEVNLADGVLQMVPAAGALDSRLEVIAFGSHLDGAELDRSLRHCVMGDGPP